MSDPLATVLSLKEGVEALLQDCGADPKKAHVVSMVVQHANDGRALFFSNLSVVPADAEPTREQLMGLWNRVVRYRHEFELTCSESIFQMDGPQIAAAELADDLVTIVGFLKSEDLEDDE